MSLYVCVLFKFAFPLSAVVWRLRVAFVAGLSASHTQIREFEISAQVSPHAQLATRPAQQVMSLSLGGGHTHTRTRARRSSSALAASLLQVAPPASRSASA